MNENVLEQVKTEFIKNISVENVFFDSLRAEYSGFNDWYHRASLQDRQGWVVYRGRDVAALCIYKEERFGEAINDLGETLPGCFLKLCTFKVSELGVKFGERLLFMAFCHCIKAHYSSVYIQVRKGSHFELVHLLQKFGFYEKGLYCDDVCFVKDMLPPEIHRMNYENLDRFEFAKCHYPYYIDNASVKKFVISVSRSLHDRLFPDSRNQLISFLDVGRTILAVSHAICKLIVENVGIKRLNVGDLLFFYQKGGRKHSAATIECMGVVEEIKRYSSFEVIDKETIERLPISVDALMALFKSSTYVMFVKFRMVPSFDRGVTREELLSAGFEPHHRNVRQLPETVYRKILKGRVSKFGVDYNE